MSDYPRLATLELYATPLSHILVALSTVPLLVAIALNRRTSIYVTPESLVFQSLATALRLDVSSLTLVEVAEVMFPAVAAWWVIRCHRKICAQQNDVEPLLTDDKHVEEETKLAVQWKVCAIALLVILGFSCLSPDTLPTYSIFRLFNFEVIYPTSYAQSFAYQLAFIASLIDIIQPFPQHCRLLAYYSVAPRKRIDQSPLRKLLTQAEVDRQTAPRAIWFWLVVLPLGVAARLPAFALQVARANDDDGSAKVILLTFELTASLMIFLFLGFLALAPRVTSKSATQ